MIRKQDSGNVQTSSPFLKEVFVWGEGTTAHRIAEGLCSRSISVTLFVEDKDPDKEAIDTGSSEKGAVKRVQGKGVLRIDGHIGHFRILIEQEGGGVRACEAGCVLIDGACPPGTPDLSLPDASVLSLEELEALAGKGVDRDAPDAVGLWLDPQEGIPDRALTNRAFRAVRSLCGEDKVRFYILFRHIPLWGMEGQSLYDD